PKLVFDSFGSFVSAWRKDALLRSLPVGGHDTQRRGQPFDRDATKEAAALAGAFFVTFFTAAYRPAAVTFQAPPMALASAAASGSGDHARGDGWAWHHVDRRLHLEDRWRLVAGRTGLEPARTVTESTGANENDSR